MNELGASYRDALQSTTGREGTDLPLTTVPRLPGGRNQTQKPFPHSETSLPPGVGYRAPASHQLAVLVALGTFDLEALKTSDLPTLELRKELLILGRSDFIPIDSWALKLVSHEWYRGKPIAPGEVEKRFETWGELKGLAF